MEARTPSASRAREQTVRLCIVGDWEEMRQSVTKGDDRGRERVMLPRHGTSVFQITGSDSLPLGCASCRMLPSADFPGVGHHAAVTSSTDSITISAPAANWRSQLYIRYNRGGTETHPCHADGNFSSY